VSLEDGLICCTEKSVNTYEYSLVTLQKSQGLSFARVKYLILQSCESKQWDSDLLPPFCGVSSGLPCEGLFHLTREVGRSKKRAQPLTDALRET
jgi:hypothetical protein